MLAKGERPKEEEGGMRRREEGREKHRKKYKETDRQPRGNESQIPHNHVILMCDNGQERVFIKTVDSKHSLIRKHKEHFALADIINTARNSAKTAMKRENPVFYNKSCQ